MEEKLNIQQYLTNGVQYIIKDALRATLKNPKESIFLINFSKHTKKATKIRQKYYEKEKNIPIFLIASITSTCNLHCIGCYSRANGACNDNNPTNQLSSEEWENIFKQARDIGISFIVLAGGEPLLRKDVIIKASHYPEIMFPIFTNGTILNNEYLKIFDENRNLVPIISIEGNEEITDSRRGKGVYKRLQDSINLLRKNNIIFGTSLTFTKRNITTILSNDFINQLHKLGCKVIFFIEYVPMNKETNNIAPGDEERKILSNKIKHLRNKHKDMLFMSFPGDEKTSGGCLAAGRGFFHINSHGDAEACPASPYSDINVKNTSILEALDSNLFKTLREGNLLIEDHEGGCVLFEHKEEVEEIINKEKKIK